MMAKPSRLPRAASVTREWCDFCRQYHNYTPEQWARRSAALAALGCAGPVRHDGITGGVTVVQRGGKKFIKLTARQRLDLIAQIIERVDHRAMAADGDVTPTRHEMTDQEMRDIYRLADGGRTA